MGISCIEKNLQYSLFIVWPADDIETLVCVDVFQNVMDRSFDAVARNYF